MKIVKESCARSPSGGAILGIASFVTSRMLPPAEFQPLDSVNAPIFEIQQFNQNELPHFAERWFTGLGVSEVPNLVHELINKLVQGRLMQLACNPLIITMICVIFASDPDGVLPRSRADLYERFITLLMGKAVDQLHELGQLQDRLRPFGSPSNRPSKDSWPIRAI